MVEAIQNLLYVFQLEEYNRPRFLHWAKTHKKLKGLKKKKKLNWTLKAKVLFLLGLVFNLLTLGKKPAHALMVASLVLSPFEGFIKMILVTLAKIKIRRTSHLKVIGITGSFGKTSTKEILASILEKKFKVLKTPQSYNTPLGIAKVVLRNLSLHHEIFLVEMGAYRIGEIKALCQFVRPTLGILTGITKQHLERFKKFKNIILAKSELIQSLPENGLAIINLDNDPASRVAQKTTAPLIFYGTNQKPSKGRFIIATKIKLKENKTQFTLSTNINKKANSLNLETPLLGKGSISNILAAIAVALELKMKVKDIKKAVENLAPIPHRLQIIKKGNAIVIDDAYNANPEGVRAAMEVLGLFKDRLKVVVTPGLVELGDEQYKENFKVGKFVGKNCDFVIIVGRTNKKALISGASKYKKVNGGLFWVPNLDEATKRIQELALPSSVILFENDLPDQYQ